MNNIIIIKFGGSVITYKNSATPKIRSAVIQRLSRDIRKISNLNKYQLIIVHGAGSFGHPLAKKYNLQEGMYTEEQKFGFCLTDKTMLQLNLQIVEKLLKNRVPAISLPPRAFVKQSQKKLHDFNLDLITNCLKDGLLPVLFGDGVIDTNQGCSILSGDTIISYIAKALKVEKVIFLSDVDGVFDSNPKQNPQANLITEINNKNLNEVLKGLSSHNINDVTGEMRGKILTIRENLVGTPVFIVNGLRPDVLVKTFYGQPIGTKLLFR